MKKLFSKFILMVLTIILLIPFISFAQKGLKKWIISPNQVNVTSTPTVSAISGGTNSVSQVYNGVYDSYDLNGPPLFYIADDPASPLPSHLMAVYDKNNNQIGNLAGFIDDRCPEIAIVPFPDNDGCDKNKYYLFYTSANPFPYEVILRYSVVDLHGNNNLGTLTGPFNVTSIPHGEFGGIAVGKEVNGTRFLYFSGGDILSPFGRQIDKITINSSGVSSQNILTNLNGSYDFETRELDISPDGTMLAFAASFWTSANPPWMYYIVGLNSAGDFNGVLQAFDVGIDFNNGGRGVEFYYNNSGNIRLLVGAGYSGIYSIDPAQPSVGQQQIFNSGGSTGLGFSQIEKAYNGRLYAADDNKIAAIDVSQSPPILDASYDISVSVPKLVAPSGKFYQLLDQIDEENYDVSIRPYRPANLYIKDYDSDLNGHFADVGIEPNFDPGPYWESKDIYVHPDNLNPNNPTHYDPLYDPLTPHTFYVYVVVHNLSCQDFNPGSQDVLHLYWAHGSSSLDWPTCWDGTTSFPCVNSNNQPTNPILGNEITPSSGIALPFIQAGGSVPVEIPWPSSNMPDPDEFYCQPNWGHFCLLARLQAPSITDVIGPENLASWWNIKTYNNIALKNLAILRQRSGPNECHFDDELIATIGIGNPFDLDGIFNFHFNIDENDIGKPIFEQAEIKINLDEETWRKWMDGGHKGKNVRVSREDCHQLIVTGNPASIDNLSFVRRERTFLTLGVSFLTDEVDSRPEFDYHLCETMNGLHNYVGGELFRITKPTRYLFNADGGNDKTISPQESTTLAAHGIGEDAYFNWFDDAGNLIYSGTNFTVSPDITTKYKLQVIAKSDGFTSYDEVIVHVKEFQINSINPNPATDNITIEYESSLAASAYFSICPFNSNSSNNYVIDPTQHTTSLNISGLQTGSYYLRLIAGGEIKDEMTFVIIQ